jgi:hypothetical protein
MRYSSEVRWILPGSLPAAALDWFDQRGSVVKEPPRTDYYAQLGGSSTASVKLRGDSVELKVLCQPEPTQLKVGEAEGLQNQWVKWACAKLEAEHLDYLAREEGWLAVWKSRSIRHLQFDPAGSCAVADRATPGMERGCAVELTSMRVLPVVKVFDPPTDVQWDQAPQWWSLGFEAQGKREQITNYLQDALHIELSRTPPVRLETRDSAAYPAWLAKQTVAVSASSA